MIRDAQSVRDLFAPIAGTYRVANHALTFGLDGYWRRRAVRRVLRRHPAAILDVCTGTGEMSGLVNRRGRGRIAVTAIDFSEAMLREAGRRRDTHGVAFQCADATRLPFADKSFDAVTIAFALRNLNADPDRFAACMQECCRVLRDGGRLVTVETSRPPTALARWVQRVYVKTVVPRLGAWVSGSRPAYAYLAATIPRFHGAPQLAEIMCAAGFRDVRYTYLTFGLVAMHEAVR